MGLWPEHAYTFVRTRYLICLSIRTLLGRMAFPLPPNTLLLHGVFEDRKSVEHTMYYNTWCVRRSSDLRTHHVAEVCWEVKETPYVQEVYGWTDR